MEYLFKQLPGVLLAESGYCGSGKPYPSYHEVCTGKTNYLESVRIIFDSDKLSLSDIVKYYFEIHDFTQTDGQGPDIGKQYLSAIFCYNDEQKKVVQKIINILENLHYHVATKVIDMMPFYIAEQAHQDYYERTGSTPYCHMHKNIFSQLTDNNSY